MHIWFYIWIKFLVLVIKPENNTNLILEITFNSQHWESLSIAQIELEIFKFSILDWVVLLLLLFPPFVWTLGEALRPLVHTKYSLKMKPIISSFFKKYIESISIKKTIYINYLDLRWHHGSMWCCTHLFLVEDNLIDNMIKKTCLLFRHCWSWECDSNSNAHSMRRVCNTLSFSKLAL